MTYSTNYIEANAINGSIESGYKYVTPVPNSIIFTKEELEARDRRVAAEAWDAALEYKKRLDYDGNDEFSVPNKEQYINSIINK